MASDIQKEIDQIAGVVQEALRPQAIYLFGSCASGTQRDDSDIDLFVVIADGGLRPIEAMKKANRALGHGSGRPVDILVSRSSDFSRRRELPTLERTIYRTGRILYAG